MNVPYTSLPAPQMQQAASMPPTPPKPPVQPYQYNAVPTHTFEPHFDDARQVEQGERAQEQEREREQQVALQADSTAPMAEAGVETPVAPEPASQAHAQTQTEKGVSFAEPPTKPERSILKKTSEDQPLETPLEAFLKEKWEETRNHITQMSEQVTKLQTNIEQEKGAMKTLKLIYNFKPEKEGGNADAS